MSRRSRRRERRSRREYTIPMPPATVESPPRALSPSARTVVQRPVREPRVEGHMTVHFRYPLSVALAIAGLISSAVVGTAILSGERIGAAMERGGKLFLILMAVLGSLFLVALGVAWWLLQERTTRPQASPASRQRKPKDRMAAVNRYGHSPPKSFREKLEDAFERAEERKRKSAEEAERKRRAAPPSRPRARREPAFAQQVDRAVVKVESRGRALTVRTEDSLQGEIYRVTHYMYNRDVTRAGFELAFPGENGQALYVKYKDIWTRLGWVELDGRGTIRGWVAPEHKLYESDPMLRRIATALGYKWPNGRTQ